MNLTIIQRILTQMISNTMKKCFFLLCTLFYCGMCFSQQRVKVFGIDFSQLTIRQAVYTLKPKFTGNVYNSFEAKYPGAETGYHNIEGNITYAGFENCYADLHGFEGKPTGLNIYIYSGNQADEVLLKLSNAIREKYGVSPEIKTLYNHNQYLFKIGNTRIIMNYYSSNIAKYILYDVEVMYVFEKSTTVNTNDL